MLKYIVFFFPYLKQRFLSNLFIWKMEKSLIKVNKYSAFFNSINIFTVLYLQTS
jgi:hypothetical protein